MIINCLLIIQEQMKKIEKYIADLRYLFCDYDITVLIFFIGIIVHLFMITNEFVNHDSVVLFSNDGGWLISQGKWFVTPLTSIDSKLNLTYLSNLIGLCAISFAVHVICKMFYVNNKWLKLLFGFIVVSSPSLATMCLYHSMDYFGLTFLLATLSSYCIAKDGTLGLLFGYMLLVLSVAAYQPYLGVTCCLLMIHIAKMCLNGIELRILAKRTIKYVAVCIMATLSYYTILKIKLSIIGEELSSYKGMNSVSDNLTLDRLAESTIVALRNVYEYLVFDILGIYGKKTSIYFLIIFLITLFTIISLWKKDNLKISNTIILISLYTLIIPLSANIVGIISANSSFYHISTFPFVLILLVPIVVFDYDKDCFEDLINKKVVRMVGSLACICMIFLGINWVIQNNVVYQKIMLTNNEIDAKALMLANSISGDENYDGEKEIVIIGKPPYTFFDSCGALAAFDETYSTTGYGLGNSAGVIYDVGVLQCWLNNKLSINMIFSSGNELKRTHEDIINEMPVYPINGSICCIDNKYIVVKLSEHY